MCVIVVVVCTSILTTTTRRQRVTICQTGVLKDGMFPPFTIISPIGTGWEVVYNFVHIIIIFIIFTIVVINVIIMTIAVAVVGYVDLSMG